MICSWHPSSCVFTECWSRNPVNEYLGLSTRQQFGVGTSWNWMVLLETLMDTVKWTPYTLMFIFHCIAYEFCLSFIILSLLVGQCSGLLVFWFHRLRVTFQPCRVSIWLQSGVCLVYGLGFLDFGKHKLQFLRQTCRCCCRIYGLKFCPKRLP